MSEAPASSAPSSRPAEAAPLVDARGARVWRGDRVVVADLDLVVRPGTVHALVGDNGAGKSSVLLAILGALPSTIAVRAQSIGYAPQRLLPSPHLPLTVADLCALARRRRNSARADVSVKDVLAAAALAGAVAPSRGLSTLSGGELARLLTALAVCGRPALCLLDEPSASVDATARAFVDELVRRARTDGTGVLLVSHDERQVAAVADVVTRVGPATAGRA